MILTDTYTSKRTGLTWNVEYEELDSFDHLHELPIWAAGAYCFYGDEMVLVYAKKRDSWEIPGGGREEGEGFNECIIREIKEESNMNVLELFPLACEKHICVDNGDFGYVLRFAAKVEPFGDFESDPSDGEITEIKLIDPKDYKQYFNWEERGEAGIKRAKELLGMI